MYRMLPPLLIALIVAGSLAAQEQTGLTLNFAKAGSKTISGLTLESNGVRYMADVTPKGCFLRKTMVPSDKTWVVKDPVEGMVVRAADGGPITLATGVERNTEVRLLFGPVTTVWVGPIYSATGALLQPGGWGSSVAAPATPAKGTPAK